MGQINPIIVNQIPDDARPLQRISLDSNQFNEDWLQRLLFANPQLLPINDVAPHFGQVIPLAREFSVTAGAIDLLYASPLGNLCLVETKLWRNPEAHRTVLAQILDYAKDLSRMSYTDFRAKVERIANPRGLARDLFQLVSAGRSLPDFDSITFEENMRRALGTGSFQMFIVGDRTFVRKWHSFRKSSVRPQISSFLFIWLNWGSIGFTTKRTGHSWPYQ